MTMVAILTVVRSGWFIVPPNCIGMNTAPPRQKGLTHNFFKIELLLVSCMIRVLISTRWNYKTNWFRVLNPKNTAPKFFFMYKSMEAQHSKWQKYLEIINMWVKPFCRGGAEQQRFPPSCIQVYHAHKRVRDISTQEKGKEIVWRAQEWKNPGVQSYFAICDGKMAFRSDSPF